MGVLDGVKDFFKENEWAGYALPIATSTLLPGLGGSVGTAVKDLVGVDLSPMGTQALGNALVGGALGALTGGGKGALTGALVGGFTPYAAGMLGMQGPVTGGLATEAQGGYGPDIPKGSGSGGLSLFGGGGDSGGGGALAKAMPLMLMAGALSGMGSKKPEQQPVTQQGQQQAMDQQRQPLSQVTFRRPKAVMPKRDLTQYGYGPEHEFFADNRVPQAGLNYARGGDVAPRGALAHHSVAQYIEGQGNPGRSDKIPALLSDNEYVIDAETVALLGDGSPDAGAKALDALRENIRRHKGGALSRGDISPNARPALSYLPKGAL